MELAETLSAPPPIYNCLVCSHYLAPGTLACPECGALVYGPHVAQVADAAQALERESRWGEARSTWNAALQWLPSGTSQAGAVLARVESIDARAKAADDTKARWTKRLGPLAPLVLLLAKLKTALFLLFKLKFLLGLFAFFGLYWALFGWKFGLGFTLSILVHEMGHYVAVRRRGLKADLPVFLPGLGAYVRWYNMGIPVEGLASIALAGPLFGLAAALFCLGLYKLTGGPVYLALAHTGAFINLLNLIPVLGLDGAQATYALTRLQRGVLVGTALVLFALMQQYVFLFLAAGMGWRLFTRDVPETAGNRTMVFYFLLLCALGAFLRIVPPGAIGR